MCLKMGYTIGRSRNKEIETKERVRTMRTYLYEGPTSNGTLESIRSIVLLTSSFLTEDQIDKIIDLKRNEVLTLDIGNNESVRFDRIS